MDGKDLDDLKIHIKATNHKKNYGRVSRRMEKFVKLLEDKNTSQKKEIALHEFWEKKNKL